MHVGIHADTYDFFLVGESHRELLLTGPGVTRTVAMESGAEAGEILVSEETAALLPDEVLGEAEGGRAPAGARSRGERRDRAAAAARGHRPRRLRPGPIRRVLGDGRAESRAPPGDGRVRALRRRRRPARRVRRRARGRGARRAGHRRAAGRRRARRHLPRDRHRRRRRQDDPRRRRARDGAARTRSASCARPAGSATCPASCRSGSAPRAAASSRARSARRFRRTYTILGKTAALAARLMGKAKPGQVLTTSDLLERSRSTFETVELEPLTLKGIAEPVTAFDVVAVSGTAAARLRAPAAVRRPRARADDPLRRARARADGLRQPGRADRRARHGQVAARRGAAGAGAGPASR